MAMAEYVAWLEELGSADVARDGGKEAVRAMIRDVIRRAHACGVEVGIYGQTPSNYPEFAAFLMREGIASISLNPGSFAATVRHGAEIEGKARNGRLETAEIGSGP